MIKVRIVYYEPERQYFQETTKLIKGINKRVSYVSISDNTAEEVIKVLKLKKDPQGFKVEDTIIYGK